MSGFVYFIGPREWRLSRVKIGRTICGPHGRLAALQTGSPFPLEVYGYTPGGTDLERALHETFAPLWQHGEWFRMDGKLLALVSCLYSEKFGRMSHTEREFGDLVGATVCSDDCPHPTFDTLDAWMDSADSGPISNWLHDRAWEAYQAQLKAEAAQ